MSESDFYVIKSKNMAMALKWLGFEYYVYESKEYKNKKVYSFIRTTKFEQARIELLALQREYK